MEILQEQVVDYNSTYISMNLIDELDHFLGGYSKPNVEFIFSLNTFVESFIACTGFYTSLNELNHINLTSPALFPNERPILKMIVREGGLRFVNGVIEKPGQKIYTSSDSGLTRREAQQKFISSLKRHELDEYFSKSDITVTRDNIPLLNASFSQGNYNVFKTLSTPEELVSNLLSVSRHNSIQTTLPIDLFNQQVNALTKTPYSIESLNLVAKLYDEKLEGLRTSLNYKYLPIPPFTNILLSQVRDVSEIPSKLTQLRADFQMLRTQFVELEKNIYESKTMKEQADAYNKFTEFWLVFNRKYVGERSRIFYGALDFGKGADFDKAADSLLENNINAALTDLNYGKIAGNVVKGLYGWYSDRKIIKRFKGLTNIWELFENGNSMSTQLAHFERIFKVNYQNKELNDVHRYVRDRFTNITQE